MFEIDTVQTISAITFNRLLHHNLLIYNSHANCCSRANPKALEESGCHVIGIIRCQSRPYCGSKGNESPNNKYNSSSVYICNTTPEKWSHSQPQSRNRDSPVNLGICYVVLFLKEGEWGNCGCRKVGKKEIPFPRMSVTWYTTWGRIQTWTSRCWESLPFPILWSLKDLEHLGQASEPTESHVHPRETPQLSQGPGRWDHCSAFALPFLTKWYRPFLFFISITPTPLFFPWTPGNCFPLMVRPFDIWAWNSFPFHTRACGILNARDVDIDTGAQSFDSELKPPAAGLKGDSFSRFLEGDRECQPTLAVGLARMNDRDQSMLFCFCFTCTLLPVYIQVPYLCLKPQGSHSR